MARNSLGMRVVMGVSRGGLIAACSILGACASLLQGGPGWTDSRMPDDVANTQVTLRGGILTPPPFVLPEPKPLRYHHHRGAVPRIHPDEVETEVLTHIFGDVRTTKEGRELIRRKEGLRLEAYRGPSGMWLIGYGHARTARKGLTITREEAERLFLEDLREHEENIARVVKVPVTPNELSAMVSLSYTVGIGAFANSSVVRFLNEGKRNKAADAFLMWNKITRNGVRQANAYLTKRRKAERALFLTPYPQVIETAAYAQ